MKNIYPKTIFINDDGEIIPNNHEKGKYTIKKQWYETTIEGDEKIYQRFVVLEENKTKQLEIKFC